jgi:hypothetical protein
MGKLHYRPSSIIPGLKLPRRDSDKKASVPYIAGILPSGRKSFS